MTSDSGQHYHLVGVAGVGMSALAQVLLAQGFRVSGSDRFLDEGDDLEVLRKLRGAGVSLVSQDGSGIHGETAGVVVSTAIEPGNPDLVAAEKLGIAVVHRAEMLARLTRDKRCIAVTGTSGKTTVAGMIGWILECLGHDPTVVNGGAVLNWVTDGSIGNVRVGESDLWVVEADESDRSLLHFSPDWAVITNISRDHFAVEDTASLFRDFAGRVKAGVVCGPGVKAMLGMSAGVRRIEKKTMYQEKDGQWTFRCRRFKVPVPLLGRHNAENAFLAATLCAELGSSPRLIRNALTSFRGIERRLEILGEAAEVRVVDDYAHNPAKIHAAWSAAAARSRHVIGIWRPHGYGPLASLMDELVETFAEVVRPGDRLFILPVYYAGGTADTKVSSDDLVAKLRKCGVNAQMVETYEELLQLALADSHSGDTILCMGARDPELPRFARAVLEKLTREAHV